MHNVQELGFQFKMSLIRIKLTNRLWLQNVQWVPYNYLIFNRTGAIVRETRRRGGGDEREHGVAAPRAGRGAWQRGAGAAGAQPRAHARQASAQEGKEGEARPTASTVSN